MAPSARFAPASWTLCTSTRPIERGVSPIRTPYNVEGLTGPYDKLLHHEGLLFRSLLFVRHTYDPSPTR